AVTAAATSRTAAIVRRKRPARNVRTMSNPFMSIEIGSNHSPPKTGWSIQDVAGCAFRAGDAFFFRRIAAEIRLTTNPTGKGSVNVIAALYRGFSYITLNFSRSRSWASTASCDAPDALTFAV